MLDADHEIFVISGAGEPVALGDSPANVTVEDGQIVCTSNSTGYWRGIAVRPVGDFEGRRVRITVVSASIDSSGNQMEVRNSLCRPDGSDLNEDEDTRTLSYEGLASGFSVEALDSNPVVIQGQEGDATLSESADAGMWFIDLSGSWSWSATLVFEVSAADDPGTADCCKECTTVGDMIASSMRLAGIIDATETPADADAQAAIRSLNQMMGQWERDGIRLGWMKVCEFEECLPIQEEDERAVRFNFAIELGVEYGVEALPNVQRIAEDTYAGLTKQYLQVADLSVEHLPASRVRGSIETG